MKGITERFDAIIRIGTEAIEGSFDFETNSRAPGSDADAFEAACIMVKLARFEVEPQTAIGWWNDWLSK